MTTEVEQPSTAADAASGPLRKRDKRDKRKKEDDEGDEGAPDAKVPKDDDGEKGPGMTRARVVRLEQNRKAARESRRRKKVMIEELQRSVIFFSRANTALKNQNDDLTRLLMQAQAHVASDGAEGIDGKEAAAVPAKPDDQAQQAQAQAVATQAVLESQGFPAAAARAAAQTMSGNAAEGKAAAAASLPAMQPGATMQAMANFQQAAAAAMQTAMQGMQGIPGVNMSQLSAAPVGTNAQQAYTDTMTALAMQQAAVAAAAGQQYVGMQPGNISFMPHAMASGAAWQQGEPKKEEESK